MVETANSSSTDVCHKPISELDWSGFVNCLSDNLVVGTLLQEDYDVVFKMMRFSQVLDRSQMSERTFQTLVLYPFDKTGNQTL